MIQIIDVSHKILYNEIKAEQVFLTLINAAVSHELRNPLNSLIGQICAMEGYFEKFGNILLFFKAQKSLNEQEIKIITNELSQVYSKLNTCGRKMTSACKFIDFFVHDILDYTVLNKDS